MKFLSTFNQTGSMNGMIKVKTMWMITDLFIWDQREHGMHTNDALVIVLPFMIRLIVMNMMMNDDSDKYDDDNGDDGNHNNNDNGDNDSSDGYE